MHLKYTTNKKKYRKHKNKETQLHLGIAKSADMDTSMFKFMNANDKNQAVEVQKKQIALLENILPLDEGGENDIGKTLTSARANLERLSRRGIDNEGKKMAKAKEFFGKQEKSKKCKQQQLQGHY